MSDDVRVKVDDEGYLLSRQFHKSAIKRVIDLVALGITPEYLKEQKTLSQGGWSNEKCDFIDNRVKPNIDSSQEEKDRYSISDMCMWTPPDERDVFVYYDDIYALSGAAGYARIRDGYVYGVKIVARG